MMSSCWKTEPSLRPSFTSLCAWLEDMRSDSSGFDYLSLVMPLDGPLYTVENEVDAEENSETLLIEVPATGPITPPYSQGTPFPATASDDSGYTSTHKASVSSGDSTATLPSDPQSCCRKRVVFSDVVEDMNLEDEVFQDGLESASAGEPNSKRRDDSAVVDGIDSRPRDAGNTNVLTRRRSFPVSTSTSERCRDAWSSKRRKTWSHGTALVPSERLQKRDQCQRCIKQPPQNVDAVQEKVNPCATKKRRRAVVTPPTLAMDNSLYHLLDSTHRQQPPPTVIFRRAQHGLQRATRQRGTASSCQSKSGLKNVGNWDAANFTEAPRHVNRDVEFKAPKALRNRQKVKSLCTAEHVVTAEIHASQTGSNKRASIGYSQTPGFVSSTPNFSSDNVETINDVKTTETKVGSPKVTRTYVKSPNVRARKLPCALNSFFNRELYTCEYNPKRTNLWIPFVSKDDIKSRAGAYRCRLSEHRRSASEDNILQCQGEQGETDLLHMLDTDEPWVMTHDSLLMKQLHVLKSDSVASDLLHCYGRRLSDPGSGMTQAHSKQRLSATAERPLALTSSSTPSPCSPHLSPRRRIKGFTESLKISPRAVANEKHPSAFHRVISALLLQTPDLIAIKL